MAPALDQCPVVFHKLPIVSLGLIVSTVLSASCDGDERRSEAQYF